MQKMASKRIISDAVWRDAWFQGLSPHEKLIWIYILTNEHLEICGIYELTIKTIQMELAGDDEEIPRDKIKDVLTKFSDAGKILYQDHYIGIINWHQYNNFLNNPNFERNIVNAVKALPESVSSAFVPVVFSDKLNAVITPSQRRPNAVIINNKNKNKTKQQQQEQQQEYKQQQSNKTKTLDAPPDPNNGGPDPAELAASLAALRAEEGGVLAAALKHDSEPKPVEGFDRVVELNQSIRRKIDEGGYQGAPGWKPDDGAIQRAQQLELRNRHATELRIEKEKRADPMWWKQYVTEEVTLAKIGKLQDTWENKPAYKGVVMEAINSLYGRKEPAGVGLIVNLVKDKRKQRDEENK